MKQIQKSKAVERSAVTLISIAILGQWAFGAYIVAFYAYPAVFGDISSWNGNMLLAQPPVQPNRLLDTNAFGIHAIGASIIAFLGGLQIIPIIRRRWKKFHHWNGRLFVLTVIVLCITGFYLTWIRGPLPDSVSDFGTSVNGLLILLFAYMTISAARSRRIPEHERWAVRLLLVSNAQWFLRIGGFGYFIVAQSMGYSVAFDGWFFQFWTWGCFLLPLLLAELYFYARRHPNVNLRRGIAFIFALLVPIALIGIGTFSFFSLQIIQASV